MTEDLLYIQQKYFNILEKYFSNPYREMNKHRVSPHQIASSMASQESIVSAFTKEAPIIEIEIIDFWNKYRKKIEDYIKESNSLKGVYGGDIFPPYQGGISLTTSLYVDTMIYPDPFLRVIPFYSFMKPADAIYYFIKHSLSTLSLKPIVLNNITPPIAIIAPDYFQLDENVKRFLFDIASEDMLYHFQKTFNHNFKNYDELEKFLEEITDLNILQERIVSEGSILFDTDWKNQSFHEKWNRFNSENKIDLSSINIISIGDILKFYFLGRMTQINEIIYKSSILNGISIIDAPTSWQYFLWKYKYDYERSNKINPEIKNTFVVNSLQSEELSWLSRIPLTALIKLRRKGALEELRYLLSDEINSIKEFKEEDFSYCVESVKNNIEKAIKKHQNNLESYILGKKKFFGLDITPWVVTGGFSIAASLIGNVPLSILSGLITFITGCPSFRNIWKDGKKLLSNRDRIKNSPVGLFFNLKN